MRKILLINIELEKRRAIKALCKELSISAVPVGKSDYNKSLGNLAKIDGMVRSAEEYSGPALEAEMMVFVGFTSEELDDFLAAYKKASISPISHKAVMTPTNISWNVTKLFGQLDSEARMNE